MHTISLTRTLDQLEARRGGYLFLQVPAEEVARLPQGKKTRVIAHLPGGEDLRCGLNHMGDGHFFVIVGKKVAEALGLSLGSEVQFTITPDPDPLGAPIPEAIQVYLDQDSEAKAAWDALTDGKKRNIIFTAGRVKNQDLQVRKTRDILLGGAVR